MLSPLRVSFARWFQWPSARQILYSFILAFPLSLAWSSIALYNLSRRRQRLASQPDTDLILLRRDGTVSNLTELIGNTPLIRINSLSNALGVELLGKAEFLNPGGSVKDRVALRMIEDAERLGLLHPHTGSRIFEGTMGSTGISIATIARARGYDTTIFMPDDVSQEKEMALRALGADVERVHPASIVDKDNYVNLACQYAKNFGRAAVSEDVSLGTNSTSSYPGDNESIALEPRGYFGDQFESRSNHDSHFEGTGPEIWEQTNGHLHAFVSGAGTGGSIAGVGRFIKSMNQSVIVALADPEGSGLYNKVKYGVLYDAKESEGTKRRHQVDTVVEGIGINRLTKNIELALPVIDDAFRVTDAEAVSMSRFLVQHDGLFLGSTSACNLVACVKLIRKMGWRNRQTVVTILCDSGNRHFSKFWNDEYLRKMGIPVGLDIVADLLKSQAQ